MASLVKTVEMRILADAGDAQAKLDELDAKAEELGAEGVKMRFRLDDAEGQAQLDDIKAKADELGFKDVSIKVRVDGAGRAIAELAAVKDEALKMDAESDAGGLLGKLFGNGPPLSGEESLGGGIPILGSLFGPAGLAIVPAIGAALVELTGLVSGFAAAGAGAAAFAALAYPSVKKVETAYSGLNTAQQAYNAAQALEKTDPTSANKTALATAAANLKIAQESIAKLPATEQAAVKGIQQLTSEFGKMSTAFAPDAFKVFAAGLQVLDNLLPHLTPFADTFASSLGGLLKRLGEFTQSKGFGDFLKQFQSIEGPAVTAIGTGIGQVANSLGKLVTTMSGKDVAQTIKIAFDVISGAISAVSDAVGRLMSNWDGMSAAAKRDTHDVASAFDEMKHDIVAVYAGAGSWLVDAGKAIVQGLISGVESMASAAVGAVEHIGSSIVGAVTGFLGIHSPSTVMHAIGQQTIQGMITGMQSMENAIEAAAKKVATAFTSHIKTELAYAKSVAASAISGLSLTSIDLTAGTVSTGMQSYLATLKSFTADIKALSGEHLNKSLLQQLIAAGPVTGDQYAQSILTGGGAGQVNALYSQIVRQSAVLGAQAANEVYGGKNIAANNGTIDVNVTVALDTTKQDLALQIVKILKEYKRNGGGSALGIA